QYVGLFNGRHARSGTVWEGRYKAASSTPSRTSSPATDKFKPTLSARMADDPVAYCWSTCAANLGQRRTSRLALHFAWLALGQSPEARTSAYRPLLDEATPDN